MSNLLELRNVTKIYGSGEKATIAMDDISLRLDSAKPGIITVAGESGSGKTTMGMAVMGFLTPTSGQVLFKGIDLQKMNPSQKMNFRKDVQAVFQDPFGAYNPFYTVDRIINVPINQFKLATSKTAKADMVDEALLKVGLQPREILGRFPHQLSGGQRQRLVVARALLLKPELLIADEPVSMVDASLRASILETLRKLNNDLRITILYITHDLTTAYHISDAVIVLYRGSVVEAGDGDSVIKNPKHPYTQLLIDSIPWPDIEMQWGQQPIIEPTDEAMRRLIKGGSNCCKYAPRCPFVKDICWNKRPPLYQIEPSRVSACFLYEGKPELPQEELGNLFASIM
jgi:oligopeptide/dipeptide ABC transporter ATP-binding protein